MTASPRGCEFEHQAGSSYELPDRMAVEYVIKWYADGPRARNTHCPPPPVGGMTPQEIMRLVEEILVSRENEGEQMDSALRALLALGRDEMLEAVIAMDRRPLLALVAGALVALSQRGVVDEVCIRCGRINPEHGAGWRTVTRVRSVPDAARFRSSS